MKSQKDASITEALLKDLLERDIARQASLPKFENKPEKPADLAHDAGNGYNAGFIFPQS
jgi:hypothetical protein